MDSLNLDSRIIYPALTVTTVATLILLFRCKPPTSSTSSPSARPRAKRTATGGLEALTDDDVSSSLDKRKKTAKRGKRGRKRAGAKGEEVEEDDDGEDATELAPASDVGAGAASKKKKRSRGGKGGAADPSSSAAAPVDTAAAAAEARALAQAREWNGKSTPEIEQEAAWSQVARRTGGKPSSVAAAAAPVPTVPTQSHPSGVPSSVTSAAQDPTPAQAQAQTKSKGKGKSKALPTPPSHSGAASANGSTDEGSGSGSLISRREADVDAEQAAAQPTVASREREVWEAEAHEIEDDEGGWQEVRSGTGAKPTSGVPASSFSSAPSRAPGAFSNLSTGPSKKQRQNAAKTAAKSAAKADAEQERLDRLNAHRRERAQEQAREAAIKGGRGKGVSVPAGAAVGGRNDVSGGMKMSMSEEGKLIWE